MKYRIVQESRTKFKPQIKRLFGWNSFCDFNKYYGSYYIPDLKFDNFNDANDFIDKHYREYSKSKYPIITEIVK